jgi:predicted nucleic acid-binding protein
MSFGRCRATADHRSREVRLRNFRFGLEPTAPEGLRSLSAVLLDTGVIVASLDRSERFHARCADAIADTTSALVTCEAVIAESCYLLRNLNGAAEAVVANVAAGIFQVPFSLTRSAELVRDVLRKYSDSSIDLADVCLIFSRSIETSSIIVGGRIMRSGCWFL